MRSGISGVSLSIVFEIGWEDGLTCFILFAQMNRMENGMTLSTLGLMRVCVIVIYLNRDTPWSGNPSSRHQWWHVTFDETNALKWGWSMKMCNGQYLFRSRRLGLGVFFPFCVEKWWSQNKVCTVIIIRMSATTKQQAFRGFICPLRAQLCLYCIEVMWTSLWDGEGGKPDLGIPVVGQSTAGLT